MINRWAIEIKGHEQDKNMLSNQLKPPFEPHIKLLEDKQGSFIALHSTRFDSATSAKEAHEIAKPLFKEITSLQSVSSQQNSEVTVGSVVEFGADGIVRRHAFIELQGDQSKDPHRHPGNNGPR